MRLAEHHLHLGQGLLDVGGRGLEQLDEPVHVGEAGIHLRLGGGYALGSIRQLYSTSIFVDYQDGLPTRVDEYSWSSVSFLPYGASGFVGIDFGITSRLELGIEAGLLVGQNSVRKAYATADDPNGNLSNQDWQDNPALFGIFDPRLRFHLLPPSLSLGGRVNLYAGLGFPFVVTAPYTIAPTTVEGETADTAVKLYDDRSPGLLWGPEVALGLRVALAPKVAFYVDVPVAFFLVDSGVIEVDDQDLGEPGEADDEIVPEDPEQEPTAFRILARSQVGFQFKF